MENKYYTPSIEELYVGFECEAYSTLTPKTNYNPVIVDTFLLQDICDHINEDYFEPSHYRVKYLNSEDIKSLGFKFTSLDATGVICWYVKRATFKILNWTFHEVLINHNPENNMIWIFAMENGEATQLFQGIVKNKSELVKVISMTVVTVK